MDRILLEFRDLVKSEENIEPIDVWEPFEKFICDSLAPEKPVGNDRPCARSDFVDFVSSAEVNLESIASCLKRFKILKESSPQSHIKLKKSLLVSLLILCGEHGEDNVWTSVKTRELIKDICTLVCELCDCPSVRALLVKEKLKDGAEYDALFKPCLLALRPKLLKETWKAYPAAVACFSWLLHFIKSPYLSDHLGEVLPTALLLVDDFVPENRLQGIKCLHHIVDNVPRSQLSWYGQADVVYDALFTLLYHRDEMLMGPLLDCTSLVLEKLESGPDGAEVRLEWSRYDAVVQVILDHAALEDKISLRIIYARTLSRLLRRMGPAVARWLRRLTITLKHYFETAIYATEECTMAAFEILRAMEEACPERMPVQAITLSSALVRLLVDIKGLGPAAPVPEAASPALAAAAADALRRMIILIPDFASSLVEAAFRMQTASPVKDIIRDIVAPAVAEAHSTVIAQH